jgi:poly(3-hydroxybutyrate) depolymerase
LFRQNNEQIASPNVTDFLKHVLMHHKRQNLVVDMEQAPRHTSKKRCTMALRWAIGFTATFVLLVDQRAVLAAERFNRSFPEWFDDEEHVYSKAGGESTTLRYRLFRPTPLDLAAEYPLLVWLHGEGEAGDDNSSHLRWLDLVFRVGTKREEYLFFVLATQCPPDHPVWLLGERPQKRSDLADNPSEPLAMTYVVFQHLMKTEPIDRDRVYVAGVSSGGTATWELAIRHPSDFAAAAPMSSSGADLRRASGLVDVPVWAFHAEDDRGSPPDSVKETIDAVKQAGGSAHLTLVKSYGHDSWTAAFTDYELMAWLLSQRRGVSSWTPPGHLPLKWWQVAVLIGVAPLIGLAWWNEWRRRKKLARASAT